MGGVDVPDPVVPAPAWETCWAGVVIRASVAVSATAWSRAHRGGVRGRSRVRSFVAVAEWVVGVFGRARRGLRGGVRDDGAIADVVALRDARLRWVATSSGNCGSAATGSSAQSDLLLTGFHVELGGGARKPRVSLAC